MHGGVAGVGRQLPPLCRSCRVLVTEPDEIAAAGKRLTAFANAFTGDGVIGGGHSMPAT
jgi:hypothetical protein